MKKFLSICLVALCSVSAMYAQETPTPNPSKDERTGVACDTEVKVEATAKNKHFHFDYWVIRDENSSTNNSIETIQGNQTTSTCGATSTVTTTNEIDKAELTVTLNSSLISAATSGTLTFEAFFTEDVYYIINATTEADASIGTVSQTPNDGKVYDDETATLTATVVDDCYEFVGWKLDDGTGIVSTDATFTVRPDQQSQDWRNNTTHTYKAVFAKKTVNIKVTTADDQKGTVRIVTPAPANN